jgi:CRP-like cAMP-binding protein
MSDLKNFPSANHLLAVLSDSDRELLYPYLETVELQFKQDLEFPNTPVENVYFPESGVISTVLRSHDEQVEVGLIGREGVTGLSILLGTDSSPNSVYVQVAGQGSRISAADFRSAIEQSDSLRAILLKYVQIFLLQASQTALANARFKIEERLARWLLMADDRLDAPLIPLTHEFLSIMLGTRRAGVTDALHALEGRGLIKTDRGQIGIIDREGLLEWANGCYGVPEKEYRRLIGDA